MYVHLNLITMTLHKNILWPILRIDNFGHQVSIKLLAKTLNSFRYIFSKYCVYIKLFCEVSDNSKCESLRKQLLKNINSMNVQSKNNKLKTILITSHFDEI